MKGHLRAGLIALASMPIALAATGSAAAATRPDAPAHTALVHTLTEPASSVSPLPSASPSAKKSASEQSSESPLPSAAASARELTDSHFVPQGPRTNVTAVVDPIAVPVRDGILIRLGARNSGPRSITAPAGKPAASLSLTFYPFGLISEVKSLGGCEVRYYYPHSWPKLPEEPFSFHCSSTRTLRVGETYWQSFVFPDLSRPSNGVTFGVSGYAQDPKASDNSRKIVVRLAKPGSTLPVTGNATISVAGTGLALVIAGTVAIWCGRRRRPVQPAGSIRTVGDESAT